MSFIMSTAQSAAVPMAGTGEPTAANAWLTPVELLLLGAIWGASFLFQRVAAKDFGAFPLVEVICVCGCGSRESGSSTPRFHLCCLHGLLNVRRQVSVQ
jgi:hypothetical protein